MATIVNTASSPRLLCIDARVRPSEEDTLAFAAYDKAKPKAVKLSLIVGANIVDDEMWLKFCENPYVAKLIDAGTLVELDDPSATEVFTGKHVADLSRLKEEEALRAIEACKDEKQLRKFVDQDGRSKIRKALNARHRVLVPPPKQEEDVTPLHTV